MTSFDIYSALGTISEELLEEAEIPVPKAKPKSVLYMTAAAACFAVLAVGLHLAFGDGGIAAPDRSKLISIEGTYPYAADVTQYTSPATGETTRTTHAGVVSISDDGLSVDVTIPITEGEANADDTYGNEIEETTLPETGTDGGNVIFPAFTPQTEETSQTAQDDEEMAIVPRWEDMSDLDRYICLQYNGNEYSITAEKFDKSELTFLRNSEIYGIDVYTDKKYSMECAVYKIGNVSPDYMVAVLTADGLYTGFERFPYYADTLADYLEDTDFLNRVKIGEKVSIDDDDNYCATVYTLNDLPNAVERLLTANLDTPPKGDSPWTPNCYFIYSANGKSFLRVYDNGYVYMCNWHFNIGKEHTDAFIEYVKENASNVEVVPYDIDFKDAAGIPE